jgi:hypothetical protein
MHRVRCAASQPALTAGINNATSRPMNAITTSNSTGVNAVRFVVCHRPMAPRHFVLQTQYPKVASVCIRSLRRWLDSRPEHFERRQPSVRP